MMTALLNFKDICLQYFNAFSLDAKLFLPIPADCEGIRQVLSQQLAEVEIISVEDHGSQVWVFIVEHFV